MYSSASGLCISAHQSRSSRAVFFQVKYVYDCVKPSFASSFIVRGRVNASARKTTSGCFACTSLIIHSQNANGFVCGLSTRKVRTPCPIQKVKMSRHAFQSPSRSSHQKLSG